MKTEQHVKATLETRDANGELIASWEHERETLSRMVKLFNQYMAAFHNREKQYRFELVIVKLYE